MNALQYTPKRAPIINGIEIPPNSLKAMEWVDVLRKGHAHLSKICSEGDHSGHIVGLFDGRHLYYFDLTRANSRYMQEIYGAPA